jgi:hypothetical protein
VFEDISIENSHLKALMVHLRDAPGVEFVEGPAAGVLHVHKPDCLLFKVTVPDKVLEWFVEAFEDGESIWADWAEYYPLDNETSAQLMTDMASDVERCVTVLAKSEFRISHEKAASKRFIEFEIEGTWQRVSITTLTRGLI